jgi:hypothetical protein
MLRGIVGDTEFFDILKLYAQRFAYGNADTYDFITVVEDITGDDFRWYFDQWVFGQGYPIYNYAWSYNESGYSLLNIEIRQVQDMAPPYRMPITVRAMLPGGYEDFHFINDSEYASYLFELDQEPDSIIFDPGFWVLKEAYEVDSIDGTPQTQLPRSVSLLEPYPNPFNSAARVVFEVEGLTRYVEIKIYDITGAFVREIVSRPFSPGVYSYIWDGADSDENVVSSGIYIVNLRSGSSRLSKKITLIR